MDSPGFSALVKVPDSTDFNVLGLTQLERTLLALAKAGATNIFIVAQDVDDVKRRAARSIKASTLHFFSLPEQQKAWQQAIVTADTGIFFMPEPLAFDLSVLEDLKKQLETAPAVIAEGGGVALLQLQYASQLSPDRLETGHPEADLPDAKWLPIGQRTCHAVHSAGDLKAVKRRMIKNLTKPSDGIVSRHLNRKISTGISRWVTYLPVTPNQITFFTGVIAFIPCYFMYQGGYQNWLIGAATYQLASTLDGVDGEIARLKMQSSKFGQWLDTLLDFVSMIAVLLCLVAGVHRVDQPEFIRWAGKLAIIFALLSFAGLLLFIFRFKKEGSFNIQYSFLSSDSKWARAIKAVDFLGRRDFYIFFFFLLALFGLMPWALVYVGGFAMIIFLFIVQAHFQTKTTS